MGPSQICWCPFHEPWVSEIAHMEPKNRYFQQENNFPDISRAKSIGFGQGNGGRSTHNQHQSTLILAYKTGFFSIPEKGIMVPSAMFKVGWVRLTLE